MRTRFKLRGRRFQVDVIATDPIELEIIEEGENRHVRLGKLPKGGEGRLLVGDHYLPYFVTDCGDAVWVTLGGETYVFEKVSGAAGENEEDGFGGFLAPMPGKVIKVHFSAGAHVKKGDVLVIMEAMKMEHRMEAPSAGMIVSVHCEEGQVVSQGFQLLEFQSTED